MESVAIWDCVLFNDELDLLLVRLRLLAGVVDHVVIVEGTTTFSGRAKPLTFTQAGLDLSWFPGAVHVVAVDLAGVAGDAWDRENIQRAAMGAHLRAHADAGDLLLIGDVDEMPRPAVLRRLADSLTEPTRLWMDDALYYANWHQPRPWTLGSLATRLDGLGHPSVRETLGERLDDEDSFVEEYVAAAGWHLSFLGGAAAVVRKLEAYSHQELNTQANRRIDFLEACLRYGVHFAGWVPLRKLARAELDPELAALADVHPELFELSWRSTPFATLAWCSWAWMRPGLPPGLVAAVERHPRWLLVVGAPILLPVQVARNVYRRRSPLPRLPRGKEFRPSSA